MCFLLNALLCLMENRQESSVHMASSLNQYILHLIDFIFAIYTAQESFASCQSSFFACNFMPIKPEGVRYRAGSFPNREGVFFIKWQRQSEGWYWRVPPHVQSNVATFFVEGGGGGDIKTNKPESKQTIKQF